MCLPCLGQSSFWQIKAMPGTSLSFDYYRNERKLMHVEKTIVWEGDSQHFVSMHW